MAHLVGMYKEIEILRNEIEVQKRLAEYWEERWKHEYLEKIELLHENIELKRLCEGKIFMEVPEKTQRIEISSARVKALHAKKRGAPSEIQRQEQGDRGRSLFKDNGKLEAVPSLDEVYGIVKLMDGESAAGPDGFIGKFFTFAWEVIAQDVYNAVLNFFCGAELPRFITSTSILLIPKMPNPQEFSHFRPISLCNFFNKLLSRILADRVTGLLPKIISSQQTGFVKGRNITKIFLLAQEVVSSIGKKNRGGNVLMKLDMFKAYDRVSWGHIISVLRRFGFGEIFIDLVWRLLSNVWFSIIINSSSYSFFKSSRGFRQGDPLLAALFIIGAEVLSRGLHNLIMQSGFVGFKVPYGCPSITHLVFADDVLIFANGSSFSLKAIMIIIVDDIHEIKVLQKPSSLSGRTQNNGLGSLAEDGQRQSTSGALNVMGWGVSLLVRQLVGKWEKVSSILEHPLPEEGSEVEVIWMPTTSGKFSLQSAFGDTRLLVPDRLCKLDFHLPSKCFCCSSASAESIEHLFSNGQIASAVWNYFGGLYGFNSPGSSLRPRIVGWWLRLHDSEIRRLIDRILPSVVCWQIWKARNKAMFEGVQMRSTAICHDIFSEIQSMMGIHFKQVFRLQSFCQLYDRSNLSVGRVAYKFVRWETKETGWLIFNTDGCSKGNPGVGGGAGVLRDSTGLSVIAFSAYLGETTSLRAEARALLIGLQSCKHRGFENISVQSDSLLLVGIIQRRIQCPWQIRREVR
ncbi:uncharacterized protein [Coffea arabica]|uniref:Reverse transcriptase domain-containing protein n=1 Tax=Coffea arabica TaxID=13443 RepID=A0ABM4VC18_COFAR